MTSIALNGRAPYKSCVTHGFVVDLDGKKISKSSTYDKPMDAGHFVNKHGADLVRLWASSIDYTDDVPFSEEMFARLGDTYRRIRNTLRILLANLFDYDPSCDAPMNRSDYPMIDRWILSRLQKVIRDCRNAYMHYQFHKVYHTLNDFCSVHLSSLYIDITKDRLYCGAANSLGRRATQAAMHTIFRTLSQLLAPILVFTAEEAWSHRRLGSVHPSTAPSESIHIETFPLPQDDWVFPVIDDDVRELLEIRARMMQEVEIARAKGILKKTSEAKVTVLTGSNIVGATSSDKSFLEEFFMVAEGLRIEVTNEDSVLIERTPYAKCARCWRHREYVGKSKTHPDLCDRCEAVVGNAVVRST